MSNLVRKALTLGIVITPPLWIAIQLIQCGHMQWHDYYNSLSRLFDANGQFLFSFEALFSRSNEHIVVVPHILWVLNVFLCGGSNVTLGFLVLGIVGCQALICHANLPSKLRRNDLPEIIATATIMIMLFSPRAIHNFVHAMSGTAWFSANLFALLSFHLLARRRLLLCLFAACMGSLSYSTGLAIWPVLCLLTPCIYGRRSVKPLVIFAIGAILIAIAFGYGYTRPAYHPSCVADPLKIVWFATHGLGLLFSPPGIGEPLLASLMGIVGMSFILSAAVTAVRKPNIPYFFYGISAYAAIALCMVAIGRGGMGAEAMLQSRYANLACLFLLSVLVIALTRIRNRLVSYTIVLTAICCAVTFASKDRAAVAKHCATLHEIEAALRFEIPVENFPYSEGEIVTRALPQMKALSHYPFNDNFDPGCDLPVPSTITSHMADLRSLKEDAPVQGFVDRIVVKECGRLEIMGWAIAKEDEISCILVVDPSGNICGMAVRSDLARPDVAKALRNLAAQDSGWKAICKGDVGPAQPQVIVQVAGDPHFYLLPRSRSFSVQKE